MAKNYHRKEHISQRRAREEEVKRKNKQPLNEKQKKMIWGGCTVLAVALLLFIAFYAPNGSAVTWFGRPMFLQKNAVVAEMDGRYYDVASWTAPENFTLDPEYNLKTDKYVTEGYYNNNDETAVLRHFYISTVSDRKTAQEMHEAYKNSFNPDTGDLLHYEGETVSFDYFTSTVKSDENRLLSERVVSCYIPVNKGFCMILQMTSDFYKEEELPDFSLLLDASREILQGLKIK